MNVVHKKTIALPQSERRRKKHLARKDQILDAAMEIVLHQGIDALTIKRLATKLDAAVGAIYRYFPGKAELIIGLQNRAIDSLHEVIKTELASFDATHAVKGAGALKRIQVISRTFLNHRHSDPEIHQLVDTLISLPRFLLDDEDAKGVDVSLRPLLLTVAAALEHAVKVQALGTGDADVRTHILWASVHGLDHLQKRDPRQPESLKVAHLEYSLLSALFRGWGASDADLQEFRA